ncbi:hypothetical protein GGR55DRAFT_391137 [Xylaria sp. FL0064]|nr:hypothetical protein GGR55DRAFT_391137 [Xylaria sp. FL0064]
MATRGIGLIDPIKVVSDIVKELTGGDESQFPKQVVDTIKTVLERRFEIYNKAYADLQLAHKRSRDEYTSFRDSVERQSVVHRFELESGRRSAEIELESAIAYWKKDRDIRLRRAAEWENIAHDTRKSKERVEDALASSQADRQPSVEMIRELRAEIDQLEKECKRRGETNAELEQRLKEATTKLHDAKEELSKYKSNSPQVSPTVGSLRRFRSLMGDEIQSPTSLRFKNTPPTSARAPSPTQFLEMRREQELKKEKDIYQRLEATIESDYVRREAHEQAIADRAAELEKIKELEAGIKERENKVAALEKENSTLEGDVANYRKRIQEQDKHLESDKEAISKLEQREREQQTKMGELRKQAAASASDSNTRDVRRLTEKFNEIERLAAAENEDERLAACERERERLRAENRGLLEEKLRLGTDNTRLQSEVARLEAAAADAGPEAGDGSESFTDEERARLQEEIMRLKDDIRAHEVEHQKLSDALAELRESINGKGQQTGRTQADPDSVTNNNGQQMNLTQAALDEQLRLLGAEQLELLRSLEDMKERDPSQGQTAAEISRIQDLAREHIEVLKGRVQALTVERDDLEDRLQLCQEALQKARHRAPAASGAGEEAGTVPVAETGTGIPSAGAIQTEAFFARTYTHFLNVIQYSSVWGTIISVLIMMLAVIIAEGRLYANWKAANATTRALYMSMDSRPTICLGVPRMDYFWHTLEMSLTGRWRYR